MAGVSTIGGRFIPPVTSMRMPSASPAMPRMMRSIRSPSGMEVTRQSISQPASGGTTLGRVPPQIGATLVVVPPARSVRAWISRIFCASATTALRPSCQLPPACAETPCTVITKRPTPLRAVTQAPFAPPAGSGMSTARAPAAARSIGAREVGLPTSSSGVSSRMIGRFVGTFWRRISRTEWKAKKEPAFMS